MCFAPDFVHALIHSCSGSNAPKLAQIVLKFCLEIRKYVGSLSLKFEEDLLRGCGALASSIDAG